MLGNLILATAKTTTKSSSSLPFLLIIVVIFAIFYFVMWRPQSNKRRAMQQQQQTVVPGQRVRTTAGMYATVVDVEDNDVILEVAPGIEVRYIKRAIMEVLPDDSTDEMTGEPEYDADDENTDGADDEHVGDEAPEHDGDAAPAHVGDESLNGSPVAADESRAPDSV